MVIFNAALAVIAIAAFIFALRSAKVSEEETVFSFSTEETPVKAYVSSGALLLLAISSILTVFIV